MIVVGPKIMLRHPKCISSLSEISQNTRFVPVISDANYSADTVVFCTGKTYYDLSNQAQERKLSERYSFVRLEDLVPFPYVELQNVASQYTRATRFFWAQEVFK